MCGIIGYAGKQQAKNILLEGLSRLEYRGYDSAGICVNYKNELNFVKAEGKLVNLEDKLKKVELKGNTGIGHTRWATHGAPDEINSHPHFSNDCKFAVVHNGIIENYNSIKEFLSEKGFSFISQTDTEVIPMLLQYNYKGDVLETIKETVTMLKGSYALGILSCYEPNKLYAVRKDSPLILGKGNGENFIASDIPAILPYTKNIFLLEEDEYAVLTENDISVFNYQGKKISKEAFEVTWDGASAEKEGYDYFMLKEIMEQPKAIENTVLPRLNENEIDLSEISLSKEYFQNLEKIFIVACGSAYHAGLMGKSVIERLARVPVYVELASEFRYMDPIIKKDDLVIIISQSGETSDSLASLRYAKEKGGRILSVVNVKGSSIARESDDVLYTNAGPEIAVATTKAYLTQVQMLNLLGIYIAEVKKSIDSYEREELVKSLKELPKKVKYILDEQQKIKDLANKFSDITDAFFIGRGIDYAVAMEASLKLKEISYIHSEAYAAGELKHGTISLVEDNTFVVALVSQTELSDKMLNNIKEVKSRGATVLAVVQETDCQTPKEVDYSFVIPYTADIFSGTLEIIILQLLAYFITIAKGYDADKPRNLAKSVTVE